MFGRRAAAANPRRRSRRDARRRARDATPTDRLAGFDGLRALAALAIVVLHVTSATGAVTATGVGPLLRPPRCGRHDLLRDLGVPAVPAVRRRAPRHAAARSRCARSGGGARCASIPAYWVALTAAILLLPHHRAARLLGLRAPLPARADLPTQVRARRHRAHVDARGRAVVLRRVAAVRVGARRDHAAAAGRRGGSRPSSRARCCSTRSGWPGTSAWSRRASTDAVSARWLPGDVRLVRARHPARGGPQRGRRVGASRQPSASSSTASPTACSCSRSLAFVVVCNIGLPVDGTSGTVREDMAREVLFGLVAVLLVAPAALGPDASRLGDARARQPGRGRGRHRVVRRCSCGTTCGSPSSTRGAPSTGSARRAPSRCS